MVTEKERGLEKKKYSHYRFTTQMAPRTRVGPKKEARKFLPSSTCLIWVLSLGPFCAHSLGGRCPVGQQGFELTTLSVWPLQTVTSRSTPHPAPFSGRRILRNVRHLMWVNFQPKFLFQVNPSSDFCHHSLNAVCFLFILLLLTLCFICHIYVCFW